MSRSPGGAALAAALKPLAAGKSAAGMLAAAAVLGAGAGPALAATAPAHARPARDDVQPAHARPARDEAQPGRSLGLPSLDDAQRYNLSPASRTLRPEAVEDVTRIDADFVTAASQTSEEDAHQLDADPTSRRQRVGGSWVRSAGANEPLAEFSYKLMRPLGSGEVRLRIEEAGAEASEYDLLVNGVKVFHRGPNPQERGQYGGQVGLVHYDVEVPRAALRKGGRDAKRFRVTFRNSDDPGPGARIAQVWAIGKDGRDPAAPYGGSVRNPRALVDGHGAATLRGDVLGRPYAILDFGKEVGGAVTVRAKRLDGAPKVSFAFSESKQFMTSASDYSADPVGVVTETQTVRVPSGTTTISPPDGRGGFRYLMVWLSGPGAVELSDLKLQFEAAPLQRDLRDYPGAFLSSDDQLNRFWYSGAYTVQLSTIDPAKGRRYPAEPGPPRNDARIGDGASVIVDAPKRDRFIWGGDLAISDPVAYLTTGDTTSPQLAFDWLSQKPRDDGESSGVYLPLPGDSGWQYSWGEYALWWIVNYETHYRYTADRAFLDRWFDQLVGDVRWARSNVDAADDLLLTPSDAGGHWGYGAGGTKETYNNALLVHALRLAADAADAEGRADLATEWRAAADRTAAAINRSLWDEATGAYVMAPGSDAHPQDANALAALSGVAPADRADRVLSFFKRNWTAIGSPTVDRDGTAVPRYISPFVSTFELDAFADHGRTDDALDLLERTWGHMLQGDQTGTFWENVSLAGGPQLGSYTSYSHGWAAGPTSFLTNTVLGVEPTGPGFSQFAVTPHVPSGLKWAQGRVPTPKGTIYAAWKQRGDGRLTVVVSAPAGTSYTVGLPGATQQQQRSTPLTGTTTTTLEGIR